MSFIAHYFQNKPVLKNGKYSHNHAQNSSQSPEFFVILPEINLKTITCESFFSSIFVIFNPEINYLTSPQSVSFLIYN